MMRKILIFFLWLTVNLLLPNQTIAADNCGGTPDSGIRENNTISITGIGGGNLSPNAQYVIRFYGSSQLDLPLQGAISNGSATIIIDKAKGTINGATTFPGGAGVRPNIIERLAREGTLRFEILRIGFPYTLVCEDSYREVSQATCIVKTNKNHYQPGENVTVTGNLTSGNPGTLLYLKLTEPDGKTQNTCVTTQADKTFSSSVFKVDEGKPGSWTVEVYNAVSGFPHCSPVGSKICYITFTASGGTAPPGAPTTGCDQCGWCDKNGNGKLGDSDPKPDYWQKCNNCITGETLKEGGTLKPGAWTALGCISTSPQGFISWLLQRVIGIAGGIAFLLILYGGFQILTSTGDPEKLTSGKDIIVSAIAGLLMIIFSVLLLRIIGYDILQIPGFITK